MMPLSVTERRLAKALQWGKTPFKTLTRPSGPCTWLFEAGERLVGMGAFHR
jgi:hypothetical protein